MKTKKVNTMQTVIEKSQKLTALLIEYREAKIHENCLYHVVSQLDRSNMFLLVEIKTGTIKRDGTPDKIRGWLRLRNVSPETVYNYGAMPKPITEEHKEDQKDAKKEKIEWWK